MLAWSVALDENLNLDTCVGFQMCLDDGRVLVDDTFGLRYCGLLVPRESLTKFFVPSDSISLQVYYLHLKTDSPMKGPKLGLQGVGYGTSREYFAGDNGMKLALHRRKPAHDGQHMFT